ncbi:hypothetical protein NP493_165g06052 [Ridgeia piscesae]|uniref:Neurotransmitter-gated ion-channel ligand-binding domain-containing protein n=1 Tax=Ridgeia piscesae TaxID=27915 RepID=A0AAD9UFD9_RIDPI|nr:hypothetical protein NP493_165g06052 [Ridgeia piscesae]
MRDTRGFSTVPNEARVNRCNQDSAAGDDGERRDYRSNDTVPEAELQRHLFRSYLVEARPVFDPSQPVAVAIQLAIRYIVDYDEDTHVLTMVGFLTQAWRDEQLVWDPSKYTDIESITKAKSEIWIPDIMLKNPIGASVLMRDTKVNIRSTGDVTMIEPRRYQVHCDGSSDRATCVLVFSSWTGSTATIALSAPDKRVDARNYEQHRTWELSKTKATEHTMSYPCCPGENFGSVRFSISLKLRRDLNADSDADKDSGAAQSRLRFVVVSVAVVVAVLTTL